MSEAPSPIVYHIRLEGHLDPGWSEWLDGMQITPQESGETVLTGPLADQTALHGLLAKIRDMNLKLVSVNRDIGLP
jgi:hypothetical protein